ncbi:MAG: MmcQ/YjbR family DNA-binding protein [Bacteroidetes bacterium]|nr:MmcQ/YjbR family DNA-binding protein [Bacteroidota bacterium]
MNIEEIRAYCLAKKGTAEDMPFGDDTLAFKVIGKMFALVNLEGALQLNLKCDPEEALRLREEFDAIIPGYHMNKRLWNTIIVDGRITKNQLKRWIDDSYRLVVEKLPKKEQEFILNND